MKPLFIGVSCLLLMLIGCNDAIDKSGIWTYGRISGLVEYSGDLPVRKVAFALYRAAEYPPGSAAPVATLSLAAEDGQNVQFPLEFSLEGLRTGDYFLDVYGDVDPADTAAGANPLVDPIVSGLGPISIRIDQEKAWISGALSDPRPDLDLVELSDLPGSDVLPDDFMTQDGFDSSEWLTPSDVRVEPQEGKAALFGTVAWNGDSAGTLTILGFATSPPSGPPTLIKYVKSPVFPQFFSIDNVNPGTYYMMAYLDVNLSDGMTNQPGDPVSDGFRQVTVEAGDSLVEDFYLALPQS